MLYTFVSACNEWHTTPQTMTTILFRISLPHLQIFSYQNSQSNCEIRLNSQFVRLPMALAATLFCPAIIAGTTDVVCIFPHNNAIALIISSVSKRISIKVLAQTQSLHMFNTCSCFFHFKLRQKKTFHSDYLLFMDVVYFVWFVDIVEFHWDTMEVCNVKLPLDQLTQTIGIMMNFSEFHMQSYGVIT